MIHYFVLLFMLFTFIIGVLVFYKIFAANNETVKKEKEIQDFIRASMNASEKHPLKERLDIWLQKKGMGYEFGGKINADMLVILCIVFAVFLGVVAGKVSIYLIPFGITAGVILMPVLVWDSDKRDNVAMLPDIERIFSTIYIQNRAGVYLPETVLRCADNIKNPRLKKYFDVLAGEIRANNDLDIGLSNFEKNFDNIYLSSLVVIFRQAFQTGQASSMLKDTVSLMEGINNTLNTKLENKTESTIMLCSSLFYVVLFILMVYSLFIGSFSYVAVI